MGNLFRCFFSSKKELVETPKHKPLLDETEKAILQIKLKRDNILNKRNDLQKKVDKSMVKIKQLVAEKRKEEAIYYLTKKKILEKSLKSVTEKLDFVEQRIRKIEEVQDDAEFTSLVKDSNQVLKNLMEKVDMDAIREAKELDQEVNLNNEEIMGIINQGMHDQDLLDQFDTLGEEVNASAKTNQKVDTFSPEQTKPQTRTQPAEEKELLLE